jgi:hypothetical protein
MKGDDMKYLLFVVLLVAIIIIAGCASESKGKVTPEITSAVVTAPAIPTTPAQKTIEITTMVTTKVVPTPTKTPAPTKAPSKPIASPVTVNGSSGHIMRFSTVAPGIVKFTIHYNSGLGDKGEFCLDDDRAIIRLAGASTDKTLYNGLAKSAYTGTTTYNLISSGNYSLTTRGCYGWQVDIDNA